MTLKLRLAAFIAIASVNTMVFAGVTLINDSDEDVTFNVVTTKLGNSRGSEIVVKANSKVLNDDISKAAELNGHDLISAHAGEKYCGASNNVSNLRVYFDGKRCSVK